jgi:hypothetical protein
VTELRIVHGGAPTDDELAAVVTVLAVVTARAAAQPVESPTLRAPLSPWVASGLVKGTRTRV